MRWLGPGGGTTDEATEILTVSQKATTVGKYHDTAKEKHLRQREDNQEECQLKQEQAKQDATESWDQLTEEQIQILNRFNIDTDELQ